MFRRLLSWFLLPISLIPAGCQDNPDAPAPDRSEKNYKRTVLLYAVATNNLYGNLLSDQKEILDAASQVDIDNCSLLIYRAIPGEMPQLVELDRRTVNGQTNYDFVTVKEYDNGMFSTDPRRIAQVIDDTRKLRQADDYGLILWSHGTGWSYSDTNHPEYKNGNLPTEAYSFGMDKVDGLTDYINIDELADAIPSGMFDFIWFDACYMSGIETIYQLRDKCDTFVGYPTEVWSDGMPYDQTLPLILTPHPNLIGAADIFAGYYRRKDWAYTIAVVDTHPLERLAQAARRVYAGSSVPHEEDLLKYSRRPCGPFYDFRQFTLGFIDPEEDSESADARRQAAEEFVSILKEATLYSAASQMNFSYPGTGMLRPEYTIDPDNYSGISCRWFRNANALINDSYYSTLDWTRDALLP